MSDLLEKSLDEIIGDTKASSGHRRNNNSNRRAGGPRRNNGRNASTARINKKPYSRERERGGARFHHSSGSLPRDIRGMAGSRPVLRVKNIHPDLNGEDLSNLFGGVSPVEFVKFDNEDDSVAYVCFEGDNTRSNALAIEKFNGKKAMGNILIVEGATSLADRISSLPSNTRVSRGTPPSREIRERPAPRRKERAPRPAKKSAEDLDNELSAYMNASEDPKIEEPSERAVSAPAVSESTPVVAATDDVMEE
ncbi:uncharacterized protein RJT20DRAFT_16299 [Scheffersomyces xylosifermentans]|uniref:uncharacterized protein n=1 Tax=Scheffersomyces xylosifermentans TaxID=1304137 RepID=UPI00315C61A8